MRHFLVTIKGMLDFLTAIPIQPEQPIEIASRCRRRHRWRLPLAASSTAIQSPRLAVPIDLLQLGLKLQPSSPMRMPPCRDRPPTPPRSDRTARLVHRPHPSRSPPSRRCLRRERTPSRSTVPTSPTRVSSASCRQQIGSCCW